ncbi:unnamed protein product [Parajaminaea phylloscopi]
MLLRAFQRASHQSVLLSQLRAPVHALRMSTSGTPSAMAASRDRSYNAAIDALNTLQSNAATIAAIRAAGGKYNDWLIPEMVEYLRRAGHTQDELNRLNVLHITGTKGKGSTAAFANALLLKSPGIAEQSQGPRVGLYTSPHMLLVRERIRLDGAPVSEEQFANAFWHVWDAFEATADQRARPEVTPARPVYFKFLTVMAFHIFLSTPTLQAVILEVGIGGRYDSTNIVPRPVACGISTLGLDHQAVLGHTVEEIAEQKAGIYKKDSAAVSVDQPFKQTEGILRRVAESAGASSFTVLPPASATQLSTISLGLPGPHQAGNALLAAELVDSYLKQLSQTSATAPSVWNDRETRTLNPWAVQALKDARWPGRCQIVPLRSGRSGEPNTIYHLDGAHTVDSLALCTAWFLSQSPPQHHQQQRTLIFNCTMGRSASELLTAMLSPIRAALGADATMKQAVAYFDRVLFCTNTTYRPGNSAGGGDLTNKMVDSTELQTLSVQRELRDAWVEIAGGDARARDAVEVLPSIEDALSAIPHESQLDQHVLVAGSLHLVGGVMSHLKDAGALNDSLDAIHHL